MPVRVDREKHIIKAEPVTEKAEQKASVPILGTIASLLGLKAKEEETEGQGGQK